MKDCLSLGIQDHDLRLGAVLSKAELWTCHAQLADNWFFPGRLTEYQVIGRHLPTETNPTPKLYRMRIFAPNTVVAKSRFWYFLMKLRKVKKANGEIVSLNVVCHRSPRSVIGLICRQHHSILTMHCLMSSSTSRYTRSALKK